MPWPLIHTFCFSLCLFPCDQDGGSIVDGAELSRVIESLQAPIQDLYCEYEGEIKTVVDASGKPRPDDGSPPFQLNIGSFHYKSPDHYLNIAYYNELKESGSLERFLKIQKILSDGLSTEIFSHQFDSSGSAQTRHATATDFDAGGLYGRIYLIRYVIQMLRYDDKELIYEGTEDVDGRPCERYAFVLGAKPYSVETGLVHRFWLDMERNGHVLRRESFLKNQPFLKANRIQLERVEGGGSSAWMPVKGEIEAWDLEQVVARESCRVIRGTPRLNQGIKDEVFAIDYPIGTPISDHLKGVVYEFGQDRRPPPENLASAEERLQEAMEKAEAVENSLVAASRSRQNSVNWTFWGPFAVCVVAIGLAVSLYIRRGR